MSQEDVLPRYLRLRALSKEFNSAAMDCVSHASLMEHARNLGLLERPDTIVGSEEEVALVSDLAVHAAKPRRSRAVDRCRLFADRAAGSDEARVRAALRQTRFSVWRLERWHPDVGVVLTDTLRNDETWLVDVNFALSGFAGMRFAARLFWPAEFAMATGAIVPVSGALMEEVLFDVAGWLHHLDLARAADDPRFATAIYANAVLTGAMDGIRYREVAAAA